MPRRRSGLNSEVIECCISYGRFSLSLSCHHERPNRGPQRAPFFALVGLGREGSAVFPSVVPGTNNSRFLASLVMTISEGSIPNDPHRTLLVRRSLAPYGVTTTLPNCSLLAKYPCAARVSLNGKVRSTTGFSLPAKTCLRTSFNSPIAPMYDPSSESCRENRKRRSRSPWKPVVAPQVTSVPPCFSDFTLSFHVAWPTCSKTMSTPRRLVMRLTSSAIFCL